MDTELNETQYIYREREANKGTNWDTGVINQ